MIRFDIKVIVVEWSNEVIGKAIGVSSKGETIDLPAASFLSNPLSKQ